MTSSFNNSDITIAQAVTLRDVFVYLSIVYKERMFSWILYAFMVAVFKWNSSQLIVMRRGSRIIGGFMLTDLALPRHYLYPFFDYKGFHLLQHFRETGVQCFCCFITDSTFRNQGVGAQVFHDYFAKNPVNTYFTIYPGTQDFYLRNGAEEVLHYGDFHYDVYMRRG